MSERPLRIAYLSDFTPLDRNIYSGGNARIHDALAEHAGEVTILSQGWHLADPLRRAVLSLPEAASLRLRWRAHLALAPLIARGIAAELARGRYDVLFGAYAFQCLDRLRPPYPLVTAYTSDATHTIYRGSEVGGAHDSVFPGGRALDGWVEARERAVFRSTDVLLWPSQWLHDEAERLYDLDPAQSELVPWGANIAPPPTPGPRPIGREIPLQLLVVGRNWFAKGGPVAFETMQALRGQGIDARLTVIGCVPPDDHRNAHVTVHPQLNKAVPEEAEIFARAYEAAHFIVMPSYESYGFAFCEASAHGVPSLCLRVGGVPVRDGVNGHALPPGSAPGDFARLAAAYADNSDRYATLCGTTRREYEQRLNWDAWGRRTAEILRERVAGMHA